MDWTKVRNFKEHEFACKCGCGHNVINAQLVMALDMARKDAKVQSHYKLCIDYIIPTTTLTSKFVFLKISYLRPFHKF